LVERYQDQIAGVLNCFDRVVIIGTPPEICHAEAMGIFLSSRGIRLFDYPRRGEPRRDERRHRAETFAAEAALEIEFIANHNAFLR
jgi:hypothetical protein